MRRIALVSLLVGLAASTFAQDAFVRENYTKEEVSVTMRDGAKLFTSIYTPKDGSKRWPFLMMRTPYSCAPYGQFYRGSFGPEPSFTQAKYIFVYQDVRGRYMSEGDFNWMNPYVPNKKQGQADEVTDTWDTIEWLLKNVPNNNGRVGVYGTSYPGHYAAQTLIEPHPALRAVSPQAPMDDNWLGDDMHHNGAFFLPHAMNFMSGFGVPRTGPTRGYGPRAFGHTNPDGYQTFLEMGSVADGLTKYNMSKIPMWKTWLDHPDYDEYWKAQQVSQHLKRVGKVPVLLVGGWFDAEDLQGPLRIYRRIEAFNPSNDTKLVMGPWYHGSWNGGLGNTLWDQVWPVKTGEDFRVRLQRPFFDYYLKDEGSADGIPEVSMFDTGKGDWVSAGEWPPKGTVNTVLNLGLNGRLDILKVLQREGAIPVRPLSKKPVAPAPFVEWVSDPAHPVPSSNTISTGMPREYMLEDQRFASKRPDVVTFRTAPLAEDTTLLGPLKVHLKASTTGTDADFVVKLIDVFPTDYSIRSQREEGYPMGGYQMLVRGEPFRARYRKSWSSSIPMKPNEPTSIDFDMPDVCHTFRKGHRVMIQVHSSWFPVVDRNPQTFVKNLFYAKPGDFKKATQRLYFGGKDGSRVTIGLLR